MDEFVLPIDVNKFRSTNAMWNHLMLNDPWSVGYVSTLIELKEWVNKEEWEQFYYESGKERKSLIGTNAEILENYLLPFQNKSVIDKLSWSLKNINTQYGRTIEDLERKGNTLYEHVKDNGYGLTPSDCFQCVRFRTICETWNGIILRENNTIATLQRNFPSFTFKKTSGEEDHLYAVDYIVCLGEKEICALQIKPKSYLWNAPYITKARNANAQKNATFSKLHSIPVFNVISSSSGTIYNSEVLSKIKMSVHP